VAVLLGLRRREGLKMGTKQEEGIRVLVRLSNVVKDLKQLLEVTKAKDAIVYPVMEGRADEMLKYLEAGFFELDLYRRMSADLQGVIDSVRQVIVSNTGHGGLPVAGPIS
jgi:hypothetical protein